MTRAQVHDLVEHRQASATLTESLEVESYARTADWVYRNARDLRGVPVQIVSEIHRQVVELVWKVDPPTTRERPGDWRTSGVRLTGVDVTLPSAIHAELQDWSRSTQELNGRHPLTHAATHHAWFERIHPFADGNGRVGRLLLNLMLIQQGYPPAVILAEKRRNYLRALRTADNGNPGPLTEVIARAVSGALNRFLIPNLAGDVKLVPLSSLAASSGYSADYLRQLASAGRLKAVRDGRLWLSSRAWLQEYVDARDPRGGPRHLR